MCYHIPDGNDVRFIEQYDEDWWTSYIDYTKYDSDDWIKLSTIVAKFCTDSGLTAGQFDVTELANIDVIGYLRARRVSARSLIEPLQMMYLFDIVEKDKKIVFKLRGGASSKTIELTDLAAREEGSDSINNLQILYANEEELPTVVDVKFVDFSRDYESGSQRYEFKSTPARNHFTVNMPVVMTNTMGMQAAQRLLTVSRAANKRYSFAVTSKHIDLVPTDIVTIDSARMRITECKYEGGIMYFTAASEWDASDYVSALTTQENEFDPELPSSVASSFLTLLDTPPLRIQEEHIGFYAGVSGFEGSGSYWNGATVYRSTDGGGIWDAVASFTNNLTIGNATTLLPVASHTTWDHTNTVTVSLYSGTLSSSTEQAVLNGANACLIGEDGSWELMQFVDATLNADGTYTLSNLIRGRLGTHIHMTANAEYENTFILLEETNMFDIINSVTDINVGLLYRVVSIGGSFQFTAFQSFTNTCLRLKPFAVVHVKATPDFAGTMTISWIRSDRYIRDTEWNDYASSLRNSEDSERFQIDILDDDEETVLNTYEVEDTWQFAYTGTMQVADFGISKLENTIYFKIYQMSEVVGRGNEYSGSGFNNQLRYNLTPFWDDFTGSDGDPVNSTLWTRTIGDCTILNNKLRMDCSVAGKRTQQITSKFLLTDNFDIQIDYDYISGAGNYYYANMYFETVSPATYFYGYVGLRYYSGHKTVGTFQNVSGDFYETWSDNKKIRVVRNVAQQRFTFYRWTGTSWFAFYTATHASVPITPMRVRLRMWVDNYYPDTIYDWDNFKITGGNAYYP